MNRQLTVWFPRGPPGVFANVINKCGNEERTDERRVEQDAEGNDECELGKEEDRYDGERGEGRGEHDAGRRNDATSDNKTQDDALSRTEFERFFTDARHEENIVVDAKRDEEHEAVEHD